MAPPDETSMNGSDKGTKPPPVPPTNSSPTPFFSMGLNTYRVPLTLHSQNRQKLVKTLIQNANVPPHSLVFLEGGPSPTRFDTDHEPIFRQESYFNYLFGVKEPDFAACIHVTDATSALPTTVLFAPKLPPEYATFMGKIKTPDEFKAMYAVDKVLYTEDIESYLLDHLSTPSTDTDSPTTPQLYLLSGPNSDSGNTSTPPILPPSLTPFTTTQTLHHHLANNRVTKSQSELHLLRHVTAVTSLAHVHVMRSISPPMMEYQLESLFKHYCYYYFGHRNLGYTSICGCGPNAAVLHYGHAGAANDGVVDRGSLVLCDMGSEYFGYGSDVTCTYPIGGEFTAVQRGVYEGVLQAQVDVMGMMKPGVSWVDCHLVAERAILGALQGLGVVKEGFDVDEMVEKRLGAVFMPHGLGHFIGCDTHDVGGYLLGYPERSDKPGLKSLRTSRIMEENMTITVEPGCYFIDHLMDEALNCPVLSEYLIKEKMEEFRGFGGVRLEDVVLVTSGGCENLTNCPRTVKEVEHVMKGGKWPPIKDEAPQLKRKYLTTC